MISVRMALSKVLLLLVVFGVKLDMSQKIDADNVRAQLNLHVKRLYAAYVMSIIDSIT